MSLLENLTAAIELQFKKIQNKHTEKIDFYLEKMKLQNKANIKAKFLSGGEKSRLNLVKFLLNPPNLLLMDEPTTHLDLISIDALIIALSNYGGSLVFISHDVNFIRKLGNNVWHIKDGNLTKYAGDYDYYLEKSGGITDARAAITN